MTRKCPTCKEPASQGAENDHRPFCSERCQLIDLGGWLDGDYAISGEKADTTASTPTNGHDLLE